MAIKWLAKKMKRIKIIVLLKDIFIGVSLLKAEIFRVPRFFYARVLLFAAVFGHFYFVSKYRQSFWEILFIYFLFKSFHISNRSWGHTEDFSEFIRKMIGRAEAQQLCNFVYGHRGLHEQTVALLHFLFQYKLLGGYAHLFGKNLMWATAGDLAVKR